MQAKHFSKQLLSLLLTLVMLLSMLPATTLAADFPGEEPPAGILAEDPAAAESAAPSDASLRQNNALLSDVPAYTRTVYLTVSLNGELVKDKNGQLMAQRKFILPVDSTNVCTIDDAMRYAHAEFSPNGADDYVYDAATKKAAKLWGVEKGDTEVVMFGIREGQKTLIDDASFEIPEPLTANGSFQISAAIYTDAASAYVARFVGEPKQGQGIGSSLHTSTAIIMKDTAFPIYLGRAKTTAPTAYSALTGYQAVAYTMDGTPVDSAKFEGTASKGKNAELSIKFTEPGTYILSAVKTSSATITASPPACLVTVLDKPLEYSEFKLYADAGKTQPLAVSESNSNGETATYTVAVPEGVKTLYPNFRIAESMDSLGWQNAYLKNGVWTSGLNDSANAFGSGSFGLMQNGELVREMRINIVNSWHPNTLLQYSTLIIKTLPVLADLTVEGYEKDSFDPQGSRPYALYIRADQSTVDITPVTKDPACSVTVCGVTGTSGQTFTVPVSKLSFDINNRAVVKVSVHAEGEEYTDNIYTIVLERQPQDDTPTILMQPEGADYIVGKTANPLTIYASASGSLSYQWYRNETAGNIGGEPIEGATAASYTPSTADAGTYYYYCVATNTTKNVSTASNAVRVAVDNEIMVDIKWDVAVPDVAAEHLELFNGQTKGFYYRQGDKNVTPLQITAKCDDTIGGGTWSYTWHIRQGTSGSSYSSTQKTLTPSTDEAYGWCQFWCTAQYTNAKGVRYESNLYDAPIYVYVDKAAVDYSAVNAVLTGTGTAQDPWQLKDQADLTKVHDFVAQGYAFEDRHFKMTQDITLDNTWDSIGALKAGKTSTENGKNINPFSATLDGGGHTLTYSEGTSKPLFRYVREATVRNMNIFASNFKGLLLVSDYVVDYGSDGSYNIGLGGSYASGCPDTIDIENITVKSGTWISGSTFIDGGASGGNIVNIRNCVIEPGVTMGKDKDTGNLAGSVASFAGRISGTVINCVSSADLYSSSGASGIVSGKCQSMGPFLVLNCGFLGSITAGSGYVGGIIGSGYAADSAPNTPCVEIQNCYVGATLRGSGKIGGIFGGEPYCVQNWAPAYIRNNVFYGKIEAANAGTVAGGIVGFMYSLNKNNIIENNFYSADCGAQRAVGGALYVDTSSTHETSLGINYFNTAGGKSANLPLVNGYDPASKTNMNRTDDPFGKDTAKLGRPVTQTEMANGSVTALLNKGEGSLKNWVQSGNYPTLSDKPVAYQLEILGDYKTEYTVGDALDMNGARFIVRWSDGSITNPKASDITFTGFDSNQRAVITLTASYGAAQTQFAVTVLQKVIPEPGKKDTITVSFVLLGDEHHDSVADKKVHTLESGGLTPWIEQKDYTVSINATVETVFRKALEEAGIQWEGTANNQFKTLYISGIQNPVTKKILSEFDNGPMSGWMYTLNGKHPDVGVSAKFVEDGDRIIFHYTDDYAKEEGSEGWSGGSGSTNPDTTITPPASVSGDKARVSLSLDDIKNAITGAKTSGGIVIAPTGNEKARSTQVELTKDALNEVVRQTKADLTIQTPVGSVTIPNDVLASVVSQASGSTVAVAVEAVEKKSLTEEQQKLVGGSAVFGISILSENKPITSFGGKSITIFLPYTLKTGETAEGVTIWYLGDSGKLERMTCKYDKATRLAAFTTTHLSHYVVGYDAWQNPFTDVKTGDWFYDSVRYTVENKLFNGTSATTFSPNADMTRAMLVTILYRLEGKPAVSGTNSFSDVKDGEWYTDAILWANGKKLVEGYGNGLFGTNDSITREQMAVILYRYAQMKGCSTAKTAELTKFTDAKSVSEWANSAIKWAVAEGLISGTTATTLEPRGTAARAQVATILMRFAKNIAK